MQEVFAIPVIDEIKNSSSNEENKEDNRSDNIEENCNTSEMRVEDLDSLFSFENIA